MSLLAKATAGSSSYMSALPGLCLILVLPLLCAACGGLTGANVKNSNPPTLPTVAITSPASGATVSGAVTVSTSVSANTTSVQFRVDGNNASTAVTSAPFSYSLNTTKLSNGSHSLTAAASNAAGQTTTSAAVRINVNNPPPTSPTVSITSPASGATVSGTITVTANATDNAGVTKVEFYLDNSLQTTDTSSPYSWSWNTTSVTNGSHTITTKCYGAAGSTATASVMVDVNNGSNGGGSGGLTPSGPVTVSGQSGVVIQDLHITNPSGDCVTVTNSKNITIRRSEIGPCGGNGVNVSGGDAIQIYDSYIHPEKPLTTGCCDTHDGVFANGTSNLSIQGNVIAYGESNIEVNNATTVTVRGNFLLNPIDSDPSQPADGQSRGQNFQAWSNSSNVTVENNYALSSTDTSKYLFAENQEDSINFGVTDGIIARNNYITGGHSPSGCGLIADTGANNAQFLSNTLLNTGQCGIGIADGTNQLADSNKILNSTPVNGGGNTAIYVWKVTSSDPPCGPVQISNNIASGLASDGSANSFFGGGGCDPVTMTNNTFDAAAQQALSPAAQKLPPPLIPPQPANCVIASPFTNNAGLPACHVSALAGGGIGSTPSTVSITSAGSGATVSGTVAISTSVSGGSDTAQLEADRNNTGAAMTSEPHVPFFRKRIPTLSRGTISEGENLYVSTGQVQVHYLSLFCLDLRNNARVTGCFSPAGLQERLSWLGITLAAPQPSRLSPESHPSDGSPAEAPDEPLPFRGVKASVMFGSGVRNLWGSGIAQVTSLRFAIGLIADLACAQQRNDRSNDRNAFSGCRTRGAIATRTVDPCPRGGQPGAGRPLPRLRVNYQGVFYAAMVRFQEAGAVSGMLAKEPGSGLGPRFNGTSCSSSHAHGGESWVRT
ncbi:MAG: Ig-like domain-containing protein [Candidatus Acidiferrales bacterium]